MRRSRPRSPWIPLLFLAAAFWISTRTPTPTAAEPSARPTLLVLGDSLAAGYGLDPTQAFPALLQKRADEAGIPVTIVNGGVSGDTTAGGLRRLDWLLRRPVDVLLLELGGNDGLRGLSPGATRTNLTAIIRKTRDKNPAAAVVVAGMQMPPNMGEAYGREFREVFPQVAKEERATLIPFLLEGVGGVAELNQPDQIHPTAAGHSLIASNLWVILEPVLRSLPPRAVKE
ncbi:MAG: arylesterase [Verrucomicrobiales bacterium]|nr:arylesterase [Verrucomicrobiales bacterium]